MIYNFQVLTTTAECDLAVAEATRTKNKLQDRLESFQDSLENNSSLVTDLPTQLADIDASIAMLQQSLANTTGETAQAEIQIEISDLVGSKWKLVKRGATTNAAAVVDKAFATIKLEHTIAAHDVFITALTARRAEIVAAAPAA